MNFCYHLNPYWLKVRNSKRHAGHPDENRDHSASLLGECSLRHAKLLKEQRFCEHYNSCEI